MYFAHQLRERLGTFRKSRNNQNVMFFATVSPPATTSSWDECTWSTAQAPSWHVGRWAMPLCCSLTPWATDCPAARAEPVLSSSAPTRLVILGTHVDPTRWAQLAPTLWGNPPGSWSALLCWTFLHLWHWELPGMLCSSLGCSFSLAAH